MLLAGGAQGAAAREVRPDIDPVEGHGSCCRGRRGYGRWRNRHVRRRPSHTFDAGDKQRCSIRGEGSAAEGRGVQGFRGVNERLGRFPVDSAENHRPPKKGC